MYLLFALLSAFFGGLVALFGKLGVARVDSTLATTVRAAIMFFFFLVAATVLGKWRGLSSIDARAWQFLVFSGLAGAFSWFFYFLALKLGPASRVAALDRLSLVFAVLFAVFFLKETISFWGWIGVLLMSIGAVLLTL